MTHYEVLELTTTATAADIKRAYRRLVLLTHPDRTPDPTAHARYLLVTAAYETLSHPARRFAYDAALRAPAPPPRAPFAPAPPFAPPMSPGRARDAARRHGGAHSAGRRVPDAVRYAAEYARVHQYLRPLLLAVLALCGSLALDYFLARERPETVLECYKGNGADVATYRSLTLRDAPNPADEAILARLDTREPLSPGTRLLVQRTLLWKSPLTVRTSVVLPPAPLMSMYHGSMPWVVLTLLGCTLFALRRRAGAEARLMAALLAVAVLIVVLYKLLH